ncbi:hypothetical protein K502DRAFT_325225 [Neoconidiobolus thromboides FSU 785]|nr:hypothetical protein K502DRAFT_325225 [Neoconidiobolus thromboides FSU 785]
MDLKSKNQAKNYFKITIDYMNKFYSDKLFDKNNSYYFKLRYGKEEVYSKYQTLEKSTIYFNQEFIFDDLEYKFFNIEFYKYNSTKDEFIGLVDAINIDYIKKKNNFREWFLLKNWEGKSLTCEILIHLSYHLSNEYFTDNNSYINSTNNSTNTNYKISQVNYTNLSSPKIPINYNLYQNKSFSSPKKFTYPTVSNYGKMYLNKHLSNNNINTINTTNTTINRSNNSVNYKNLDDVNTQSLPPSYSKLSNYESLTQPLPPPAYNTNTQVSNRSSNSRINNLSARFGWSNEKS